jgi:3-phenylpropionate/trans-cinnamate dioxygenase ferredoxin subunit
MSATIEAGFRDAGPADLAIGAVVARAVGGREILLARGQDGMIQAVAPRCSHADLPLAGGRVRGTSLVCPHHGARFCLKTGRALGPPAFAGIAAYPTRTVDGMVEVWLT